jgi:hypothetical protein
MPTVYSRYLRIKVRNEKNRILEENRMLSKEVDRAYLERDRLRYSRWTGPTWRGTGSGIAS